MSLPLHIEHELRVVASTDAAGTQTPLNRDEAVAFDSYRNGGSYLYTLAANATNASLPMLGVTEGKLLFLELEAGETITVRLNNVNNTAFTLKANPSGIGVGRFFLETASLTAVYLTSTVAHTIRVWVGVFGD